MPKEIWKMIVPMKKISVHLSLVLFCWIMFIAGAEIRAEDGVILDDPSLPPVIGVWQQSPDEAIARYTGSLDAQGVHYEGEVQLQHVRLYSFRFISRTVDGNDEILTFEGTIATDVPYFHLVYGDQSSTMHTSRTEVAQIRIRVQGKAGKTTGTYSLLLESLYVNIKAQEMDGNEITIIEVRNVSEKESTGQITITDQGEGTYLITGYLDAYTKGAISVLSAEDYFEDLNGPVHLVLSAMTTDPVDLAVVQTADSGPIYAGANLTYTLTVTNNGSEAAQEVILTDALPEGAAFISAYSIYYKDTLRYSFSENNLTCELGRINAGASETVKVTVAVPATAELTNSVRVMCMADDPILSNNLSTLVTAVSGTEELCDLEVSQSAVPDPASADETLTYTVTVTNKGDSAAADVRLIDIILDNIWSLNVNAGQETYSTHGDIWELIDTYNVYSFSLGTLEPHASRTIILSGEPSDEIMMTNIAIAISSTPDADHANNKSVLETPVSPTDLSVSQTADPDPVLSGGHTNLTITITNQGAEKAGEVILIDTLSDNASIISAVTSSGECYSGIRNVACPMGSIYPGETETVTLAVRPLSGETMSNKAVLKTETPELTPADNTSSITIGIIYPVKGDLRNTKAPGLADAILALKVASGMNPDGIREDYVQSGVDVDGDFKISLPEVIYILQKIGGILP